MLLPEVAAGLRIMSNYSSEGTTAATPLVPPPPEMEVQVPVEQDGAGNISSCEEDLRSSLVISMDDRFDFLDRENISQQLKEGEQQQQEVMLLVDDDDTPVINSTFSWSDQTLLEAPSHMPHAPFHLIPDEAPAAAAAAATEAEVEAAALKDQDAYKANSSLPPLIFEEQGTSMLHLQPSSEEQDPSTYTSLLLQSLSSDEHAWKSKSLLQPLSEDELQQLLSGDHELLSFLGATSVNMDDLIFKPDLGLEEDGDLNLAALDDIPLWP